MHSVVIYTTTSGNTGLVAEAVAEALRMRGTVDLLRTERVERELPAAGIVFVGGPTERHSMSEPMAAFLGRLSMPSVRRRSIATFDTRLRWPRILSGSAADDIARRLRAEGARIVARPESFMVSMAPRLVTGELERAAGWATRVAEAVDAKAAA